MFFSCVVLPDQAVDVVVSEQLTPFEAGTSPIEADVVTCILPSFSTIPRASYGWRRGLSIVPCADKQFAEDLPFLHVGHVRVGVVAAAFVPPSMDKDVV